LDFIIVIIIIINEIKKEADKVKDVIIELPHVWHEKEKVIPVNNRGDWNHFRISQTKPEKNSRKARN
jgi:hypothetical protein